MFSFLLVFVVNKFPLISSIETSTILQTFNALEII